MKNVGVVARAMPTQAEFIDDFVSRVSPNFYLGLRKYHFQRTNGESLRHASAREELGHPGIIDSPGIRENNLALKQIVEFMRNFSNRAAAPIECLTANSVCCLCVLIPMYPAWRRFD